MTTIIGAEVEGASSVSFTAEKGYLTKRVALATAKVAKIALKVPATNKSEVFRLGIFAAAASKPSTFLAETGTISIPKESAGVAEGTLSEEIAIVEGTEYFLGVLVPSGGVAGKSTITEKTGWGFKSTLAITELNKGVFTSAFNAFGEPAAIWGIEGASTLKGKATGTVLLTGTSKGLALEVLKGKATGPVLLTGTSKAFITEVLKGKATGPILLTGTSHGLVAGAAFGKATGHLLLTGTSKGTATTPASGGGSAIWIFED